MAKTGLPCRIGKIGPGPETKKAPIIGAFGIHGAQGRNRTVDTRIFSPLLYRLSYLGFLEVLLFFLLNFL